MSDMGKILIFGYKILIPFRLQVKVYFSVINDSTKVFQHPKIKIFPISDIIDQTCFTKFVELRNLLNVEKSKEKKNAPFFGKPFFNFKTTLLLEKLNNEDDAGIFISSQSVDSLSSFDCSRCRRLEKKENSSQKCLFINFIRLR